MSTWAHDTCQQVRVGITTPQVPRHCAGSLERWCVLVGAVTGCCAEGKAQIAACFPLHPLNRQEDPENRVRSPALCIPEEDPLLDPTEGQEDG